MPPAAGGLPTRTKLLGPVRFGKVRPNAGHRIVLYGPGGIGKTTLAATAPEPVGFIDLDDSLPILLPSLGKLDVRRVAGIAGWQDIRDALALRGVEDDSETIARLVSSAKFRGASMSHKTAILEKHVDVARLFGPYTWDTLPTRYLTAYTPADKLAAMDAVARQRAGKTWPGSAPAAQHMGIGT